MPTLDKLITVNKLANRASGEFAEYMRLHAEVNQKKSQVKMTDGSERTEYTQSFKVRWSKKLAEMQFDLQSYTVTFCGVEFRITGYDDYMQQHQYVTLTGVVNGKN